MCKKSVLCQIPYEAVEHVLTDEGGNMVTMWGVRSVCEDGQVFESLDLCESKEAVDELCRRLNDDPCESLHLN